MRLLSLAAFALLMPGAFAGDQDYYLSAFSVGAIIRVDADTKVATPHVQGVMIPHYGTFLTDGDLYMPDRGWPAVLRITQDGTATPFAAGGYFVMPVTAIAAPAGDGILVSDMAANRIVHVDFQGNQTLWYDNSNVNGLFDWPDGMAFDGEGNLFVANFIGNTIVKIDPQGNASVFSNSPLIMGPGGVVIDGSGNLYSSMYGSSEIVRFRLDTGEAETFAFDIGKMSHPSDLRIARSGGLLVTGRNTNLARIDPTGNISIVYNDPNLGEIVGIAVPEDAVPCSGTFESYGSGVAGSGGFVPQLRAIYSPCPGELHGMEFRDFVGGAPIYLLLGAQPASQPFQGGTLLVDLSGWNIVLGLPLPGVGAGNGDAVLPLTMPDDPNLVGLELYWQAVAVDPGAAKGLSFSNGMHETIGS